MDIRDVFSKSYVLDHMKSYEFVQKINVNYRDDKHIFELHTNNHQNVKEKILEDFSKEIYQIDIRKDQSIKGEEYYIVEISNLADY